MLSTRLVETHPLNRATQVQAWRAQIDLLRHALTVAPRGWRLLLEYPLLRLGRRIDAVLLTDRAVLVLEFKVGAPSFSNIDRQQVEDYALDLSIFTPKVVFIRLFRYLWPLMQRHARRNGPCFGMA